MKQEIFFENFELLSDAPNIVQKLREMIFQLAVQGKLVSQDPNDEPASLLLERIQVEKDRLVKEKKITKSKPPTLIENNNPFELPLNWKWTYLHEIGLINPRNNAEDDKKVSFIPMELISETFTSPIDSEKRQWGEIKKGYTHFAENDVVLAKITPCFQNGKSAVMRGLINGLGAGTTELHVFRPIINESVYPEYILIYLRSPQFLAGGIEKMTGTAGQKRVPKDYFAGNPFPLAPYEEQKRIVAKVDQLMTLCDQLEARQQKKHEKRIRLNNAALDKLLTAPTPGEFAQHWQRICDNFDLLYDAPETVGQLRQAILQLAVQGKLVPQDPGDEPAEVLLEKINLEKDRLLREKKIKKQKQLPLIEPEDLPFNLPRSWKWVRLGEVVDYNGALKVSPNKIPDDSWLLELEDIEKDTSKIIKRVLFRVRKSKSTKAKFEKGDVLYGKLRPYLNKVVLADEGGFCTTEIIPMHGYFGIFPKYLMYSLKRPDFLKYVNSKTYGINLPRLGTEDARSALFPLPPFEEQKRIVAKVDRLMALCDELEAGLVKAQTEGGRLMEAAVHHVLAG